MFYCKRDAEEEVCMNNLCRKLHSEDGQKRAEVCAESSRWPKWLPELEYATAYMCFKFSKFGKAGVTDNVRLFGQFGIFVTFLRFFVEFPSDLDSLFCYFSELVLI